MHCRSLPLIHEVICGLSRIGPDAVTENMYQLLSVSDVWIIWGPGGDSVGTAYFSPITPVATFIHGGFWDGKLSDKAGIIQALIDTREEDLVICPLREDRQGKIWAWWLKKNLGFNRVEPYNWMEGSDLFVMERNKQCLQQS
jgi:hypothetical protein